MAAVALGLALFYVPVDPGFNANALLAAHPELATFLVPALDPTPALGVRLEVILDGWQGKFFSPGLLRFAFQICLVLVTGHALALSPPVQRGVAAIAAIPKNTAQAAMLVAIVAEISGVIHWGLGAVIGAFLAREIGRAFQRQGRTLHYPILGAAAYMGLLVWHGGLSGSAPLKVAESNHFLVDRIGVISADQTLFSSYNLIITGVILVVVPLIFWLLSPRDPATFVPFIDTFEAPGPDEAPVEGRSGRLVSRLENSVLICFVIGGAGLAWTAYRLVAGRANFDLDALNFLFLFAGLLLQSTPANYARAVSDGVRGCGGIILQFPFYFGILGIFSSAGLIDWFAGSLASMADETTLPIFAFLSAAVVNLFIPSGGGQWAVQGDVLVTAAQQVGADVSHTIMAFSYGDQLTNMLQPFWALPLLGITGLKARQIIGYTGAVMLLVTPIYIGLLWVLH
jgi:short-chain fatty acids transporter